jgi:diguanylate cyclase (GGDEF)-like protein
MILAPSMNTSVSPKIRLRASIVAIAVVALVLVDLFAVTVTGIQAHDESIAVARDAISREGDTTIQSILRHLEPAQQSANVTSRLLADGLLETTGPSLERYLYTQLAVMPQMTGAFVGFPNGDFVFVSRESGGFRSKRIVGGTGTRTVEVVRYDPNFSFVSIDHPADDTFDPRSRPWYAAADKSDRIEWTDPYIFFTSGKPGITAAKAVHRGDSTLAVVGVEVELSGLAVFLDNLARSKFDEAFVVSGNTIVAAPSVFSSRIGVDDQGALRLLTINELGVPALAEQPNGDVRRVTTPDGHDLVLHRRFPASTALPWSVVVRAPESAFTKVISHQQRQTLLILLAGGFAVLGCALALLRMTRPLRRLNEWASIDDLTGLANRRVIYQRGTALINGHRTDVSLSVLIIDLDNFKTINDRYGHHAGDEALRRVADALKADADPEATVGRLGGDEFVVLHLAQTTESAYEGAKRLVASINAAVGNPSHATPLGASAGLSVGYQGQTFEELLREADAALIESKSGPRGGVSLYVRTLTTTS